MGAAGASRLCETRREANARLKELQEALSASTPGMAARITVGEWLREWLAKEIDVKPRTAAGYQQVVEQHLTPAFGRVRLRELSTRHVRDYREAKRMKGLSPRTVQYHLGILRHALRVAESHSLVERNVARLVTSPTVGRHEIVPLTPGECATFLAAVRGERLEPLYKLAMFSGLRQSELLGLTWGDIDFSAGTLRVSRTLQRYAKAFHLDEPKTEKSRRVIALPAPVLEALRAQRTRQLEERLEAGPAWEGCWDLVFLTENGRPLLGTFVTRSFQAVLKRAGLPHVRFHDLRHGAATYLLAAGVELKTISEILGHSQIHVTANTYAHVMIELKRDAADKLGAVLFGS